MYISVLWYNKWFKLKLKLKRLKCLHIYFTCETWLSTNKSETLNLGSITLDVYDSNTLDVRGSMTLDVHGWGGKMSWKHNCKCHEYLYF